MFSAKTMERAYDAVAEALGDAKDCIRTWSAWSVGTMRQDDFTDVADDSERVREITKAAMDVFVSSPEVLELQGKVKTPFDYQRLKSGSKAETVDGREATYIGELDGLEYGLCFRLEGDDRFSSYNKEGGSSTNQPQDFLVMAPDLNREVYLTRWSNGNTLILTLEDFEEVKGSSSLFFAVKTHLPESAVKFLTRD